jgi:hypothetical protein
MQPAFAHEEIFPTTVTVGRPSFLTVSAANEREVNLIEISLNAPEGAAFGEATRDPGGWKVTANDKTVTWSGGSIAPARFAQWGIELEGPDQPGSLSFKATLKFTDGKTEESEVPITAVADTGVGAPTTTTAVSSTTATTAGGTAVRADADRPASSSGRANAALVVAILAALLALASLARGRRTPTSAPPSTAGKEQDW